jgi:fluoride exporter
MAFLFVALGGAIGAMARYAISLIPVKTGFPVLTLITNILGAILIGFIVGIASSNENISENAIFFLKTGVCGGFTTFSTFSLEAYNLFEGKQYAMGSVYVVLSCLGCILGVLCGKKLAGVMRS